MSLVDVSQSAGNPFEFTGHTLLVFTNGVSLNMGAKSSKRSSTWGSVQGNSKAAFRPKSDGHLVSIKDLDHTQPQEITGHDFKEAWTRFEEYGFIDYTWNPQSNKNSFHDPLTLLLINELDYYQHVTSRFLPHLFQMAPYLKNFNPRRINTELSFDPNAKQSFLEETLPAMVSEYQSFMLNLARKHKNSPKHKNVFLFCRAGKKFVFVLDCFCGFRQNKKQIQNLENQTCF